ncbi:MAG: hypothetical protein KC478_14640 [Bacteriovoracaceae bacterium]|nr:hypothetical protein [Bacteriovoracaceae bacterium]
MKNFLDVYKQFKLGTLTTESFHPVTTNLSELSKNDLPKAIELLQTVDRQALGKLKTKLESCYALHQDIKRTIANGEKVFLCGCGATGRLSLALESFWRAEKDNNDQVVAFMAGGDYALVKSVESFEDNASFGSRQLEELGYNQKDLLLGITEGGETSFVIGAIKKAQQGTSPWFIYCNPDEELQSIERSNDLLINPNVYKLNLTTGPMAISGSTRMQASSVQMLAVYFGLFYPDMSEDEFIAKSTKEIDELIGLDACFLTNFITAETRAYNNNQCVTYVSDPSCAMTILTDTTERSPTFSLAAFEKHDQDHRSLAYLTIANTHSSEQAWHNLLGRVPRTLEWNDLPVNVGESELYKFDISSNSVERREGQTFDISKSDGDCLFRFLELEHKLKNVSNSPVLNQIALKLILNIHSTLIMARLGRVEGNVMSYVRPSNYKLVDRATRYVLELAARQQLNLDYLDVAKEVVEQSSTLVEGESVVMKSLEALKN